MVALYDRDLPLVNGHRPVKRATLGIHGDALCPTHILRVYIPVDNSVTLDKVYRSFKL